MVRLPEKFIIFILSWPLDPKATLHSKLIYMGGGYVSQFCGCAAGRKVQPIAMKFGTKFSLDVTKNLFVFGDFSPKGVEMVGGWNLKKIQYIVNMNDTSMVANG